MRMAFLVLALASSVAALPFAAARAQIIGHAPWCAVSDTGGGRIESDCEYYSIEECRSNVLGGNRGFCQMNPYYRGPVAAPGHLPRQPRYVPER